MIKRIPDQAFLAASEVSMRGGSVMQVLRAAAPYMHCGSCEGESACDSARVAEAASAEQAPMAWVARRCPLMHEHASTCAEDMLERLRLQGHLARFDARG